MKKILILIVVVATIMVLLKIMGGKVSLINDSKENIESDEWKVVNTVLLRGNRHKDVIGADLPKSAQDVHYEIFSAHDVHGTYTKFNQIVAKISKDDFDKLTSRLELTKEPDLLTIWPKAFDCEDKRDIKEFWNITKSVDENTYYGEDQQIESRIMLKYEEGTLYVKRATYYDRKIGPDDLVYLKVRKR